MGKVPKLPDGMNEQLDENMTIITTIFSPALSGVGIVIVGEGYHEDAEQVIVRIYLVVIEESEWVMQDELQAFALPSLASAETFVDNLPSMSALDLMLVMSGHGSKSHQPIFYQ